MFADVRRLRDIGLVSAALLSSDQSNIRAVRRSVSSSPLQFFLDMGMGSSERRSDD